MGIMILNTASGQIVLNVEDPSPGPEPGELNATHHFTEGWATFGQVITEGVVPAGYVVKVGSLETQYDVLATWADGSAKFAVVTCEPTAAGDQSLNVVPAGSGSFTPVIPTASVVFTISGVAWTATLPSTVSADPWLDGPLVREWRWVITPLDPSSTPHPFLRVYIDTRVHSDGQARVDVTVENCLDVAGATMVTYDAAVTVDGSQVFTQAGVVHYYLQRWRKVFGVGLTESAVTFDFAPAHQAQAVPRYMDEVVSQTYSTAGDTFAILGRGSNTYDNMGTTGGRSEIAWYPDWAADYLVNQTANQRDHVLANGDLAGSWPIHIRESNGELVSIDARPRFWLDARGQGESYPVDDRPKGDLSIAGPLIPDTAHTPSFAYIPYLITGDRYYADELAFWANWGMIYSTPSDESWGRKGSVGLTGVEQTRGRGWSLRNLADAAAYLPDGVARDYFADKVANNLEFFGTVPTDTWPPKVGVQWLTERDWEFPNTWAASLWEHTYLAWAIDHANRHGFPGGALLRDQIVQLQLDLFQTPGVPPTYAGAYLIHTAKKSPYEIFATILQSFEEGTGGVDLSTFAGFYGMSIRGILLLAIADGRAGAQAAYDYLTPQIASDIANRGGWSIAPYA